jgi:hypothetical protein
MAYTPPAIQPPAGQYDPGETENAEHDINPGRQIVVRDGFSKALAHVAEPSLEIGFVQFQPGDALEIVEPPAGGGQSLFGALHPQRFQTVADGDRLASAYLCQPSAFPTNAAAPGQRSAERFGGAEQSFAGEGRRVEICKPVFRAVGPQFFPDRFVGESGIIGRLLGLGDSLIEFGQPRLLGDQAFYRRGVPAECVIDGERLPLRSQFLDFSRQAVAAFPSFCNFGLEAVQPFETVFGKTGNLRKAVEFAFAFLQPIPGPPGPLEEQMPAQLRLNSAKPALQFGDFLFDVVAPGAKFLVLLRRRFQRPQTRAEFVVLFEQTHQFAGLLQRIDQPMAAGVDVPAGGEQVSPFRAERRPVDVLGDFAAR